MGTEDSSFRSDQQLQGIRWGECGAVQGEPGVEGQTRMFDPSPILKKQQRGCSRGWMDRIVKLMYLSDLPTSMIFIEWVSIGCADTSLDSFLNGSNPIEEGPFAGSLMLDAEWFFPLASSRRTLRRVK